MSEQSLFRRFASYKPYSGSQKNDITLSGVLFLSLAGFRHRRVVGDAIADLWFSKNNGLFVKCWGADYKISQYNIFGYQNLSVSRSIKVYVF